MASLHKDPRGKSPFWFCALTFPDGKRTFRSTKQRDRKKAWEICLKWDKAILQAKEGILTEIQSRKLLDDIRETVGQSPLQNVKTQDFLTQWTTSKETTKAAGTAKRYRHTIETFLQHIGRKASQPLSALIPSDIETFRDLQIKEGKSAATANMVVKTLRIPLNLAKRQGFLLSNPAEAVELLQKQSASRETFTIDQLKHLLESADLEWKGMILLGACTGMRIGDAARLTWKEIDLQNKIIRYQPQKTVQHRGLKPLEVIILPDLENYLLSLPIKNHKADTPLFPTLFKKKVSGGTGLSQLFVELMHQAGIDRETVGRKVKGKGRQFFALGFHSLRHTYVSLMANAGISRELRMKLAGHTSEAHDRYTHFERETLHKELSVFPRILKG